MLLYEIHTIDRFASAGDFLSYARLISGRGESAGKLKGVMGRKIGNAHLKWAFAEAACLMIRELDQAKRFVQRLEAKHGKPHALAVLRARIGRAVYYMLKRREPFDLKRFFGETQSSKARTVPSRSITGSSSLSGDASAPSPAGEPHANDRSAQDVVSRDTVQNPTALASRPTLSDEHGRSKHRPISTAPRRGSTTPARRRGGR